MSNIIIPLIPLRCIDPAVFCIAGIQAGGNPVPKSKSSHEEHEEHESLLPSVIPTNPCHLGKKSKRSRQRARRPQRKVIQK
jgi:hypothetical protein